ncbi:TonB-dependent receptor [Porphyromonas sp.]|uniref:TonB-dependent receptor n=1 Tax=Porphyromonas sp. TaxID=1924944 RepID=UPI0026DD73EB|nr:TonB-dependent receptor [Porphyromonas sp.]MDO4695739.1 TonB-dependent receptor [Porphyromonas sp.]MDO4771776.1 TonB-dependent receptor [Porphyromonas sp.]
MTIREILPGLIALVYLFTAVESSAMTQPKAGKHNIIVSDKETNEPISYALAQVGNMRYMADTKGTITIPLSITELDTIKVQALGYMHTKVPGREIKSRHSIHIHLIPQESLLNEVSVEGIRAGHSKNVIRHQISATEIQKQLGSSFASTLEQVKGISMIQTGATIAKPVLHGMYGNRLLIVNNGVRQQGQQWGADHAPELDANTAGGITIIKGAEAVRYGSEALGGVIELDSRSLPYGSTSSIHGNVSTLYGSNGHRAALTGFLHSGTKLWGGDAAWRVQGTHVNGGDRSTADYVLNNTGMRESNASIALGWEDFSSGIDLYYSLFSTQIGVLYSAQMGSVELLKERIKIGQPVDPSPFSRKIDYPLQKVTHHIFKLKGHHRFANKSKLDLQAAYQGDFRNEHHQRRNYKSHIPSLSLNLHSLQIDARWKHLYGNWSSEAGAFYGMTNNYNTPGTGVVPIIPNYTQNNGGIYAIQKYSKDMVWGAEIGLRADHQLLNAEGIDYDKRPYGGKSNYTNLSYNIGAHYHASKHMELKTNLGLAWRAPHVHELYSKGLEHASGLYSSGDATLGAEQSTKWVTSLSFENEHIAFNIDTYLQWIKGYIYDEPSGEFFTLISGTYPVFQYKSTDAIFRGIDAEVRWHISRHLEYEIGGSMIRADEQKTGNFLPYIPSGRIGHHLTYRLSSLGKVKDIHIKASHRYVAKQHRFDPATDLIPYSPDEYHLLGLEAGLSLPLPNGQSLKWLLSVDNLLNKSYREYTNRFRYYAHDLGRDVRLMMTWEF